MPQAFKVPTFDPANIASKLPEPLRKPAGIALQGLKEVFGGGDISDMAPVAGTVRIPLNQLQNLLRSGFAEEMISKAKSPILREANMPGGIGSHDIARIASGMRPETGVGLKAKPTIPSLDIDTFLGNVPSKSDSRLAAQELYNMTQRTLDELRVPKGESVELFRGGPIPKTNQLLTPTHIDPDFATSWGKKPFGKYDIPRDKIRALVGLLHRGDDLTEGELLIPALDMVKGAQLPIRRANPTVAEELTRIPSWFKKSVR